MVNVEGAKMQLELIRFILACASVLEKITLEIPPLDFYRFLKMMEKKLKEFPQASTGVKFIFFALCLILVT